MRSVNLISLKALYEAGDEDLFNSYVGCHGIGASQGSLRKAEMEDIICLLQDMERHGATMQEMDCFYVGFSIPQIGKEFDLLRFGDDTVINIEVKRKSSEEKVEAQLHRNEYYLSFLPQPTKYLFAYVCDSGKLYCLKSGVLEEDRVDVLVDRLREQSYRGQSDVARLFDPANYLVSPFNSPVEFEEERYFLTRQQEEIKKKILKDIKEGNHRYLAVTGRPGTGKTLLVYDIVSTLMKQGKKVKILHCAKLNDGQQYLVGERGWDISCFRHFFKQADKNNDVVVIDEAQRILKWEFNRFVSLVEESGITCIFSFDETQYLSIEEGVRNQVHQIRSACEGHIHTLTGKIRTNPEVAEFISRLFDKCKPFKISSYPNISISYCKNGTEAKGMLCMLKEIGWTVPTYTPSIYGTFHYESYHIDSESAHEVIGQEFDRVVGVIDSHFMYNDDQQLTVPSRDDKVYSQLKMFYQIVTRTRKQLHILIIGNKEVARYCVELLSGCRS